MDQVTVDCATGARTTTVSPLEGVQLQAQLLAQGEAQQRAGTLAAEVLFAQQQRAALGGVRALLHGSGAAADAAALAGLVHKLTADPVQPLSAPEVCTLARFLLRCLLP